MRGRLHLWIETGTEGIIWAFQDNTHIHGEGWSYEGLHVLRNGDFLKVLSNEDSDQIIWQGEVSLRSLYPKGGNYRGIRISDEPTNISLEEWGEFFEDENEAILILREVEENDARRSI